MKNDEAQREIQNEEIKESLGRIKRKIVVMSGKGGVGKSCVAVNIAVGLSKLGYKVGLMDVDLHGPSIPQMLGIPNINDPAFAKDLKARKRCVTFMNDRVYPAVYEENLSVVSIEGMLEDRESAVIWRGPMKIGVIRQFISDVQWDDLDYLVIDSPPGTGDEPLTVAQTIPDAEAVIVTTPQAVALRDVRKSINFCKHVKMKMLGLIENMSGFMCPDCGRKVDLFQTGGGEKTAMDMGVPFLGKIPIFSEVVKACDMGVPAITMSDTYAKTFEQIVKIITDNGVTRKPDENESHDSINDKSPARIALPVTEGKLAMHFGHCHEFGLFDVDGDKILKREVIPAPEHQPGLLPKWLHERGANVIIAGGMGSRAQSLFEENNIRVITGASSEEPEKVVHDYLNDNLVTAENVCDH